MHRQPLDFEKLDVYRCAIEFLAIAVRLGERMPRGQADLRDQLRRAQQLDSAQRRRGFGQDQSGRTRAPPRDRPWLGAPVCSDLGRSRPIGRRLSRRRGSGNTTPGAHRLDADKDVPLTGLAVLVLVLVLVVVLVLVLVTRTRTRRRTRDENENENDNEYEYEYEYSQAGQRHIFVSIETMRSRSRFPRSTPSGEAAPNRARTPKIAAHSSADPRPIPSRLPPSAPLALP